MLGEAGRHAVPGQVLILTHEALASSVSIHSKGQTPSGSPSLLTSHPFHPSITVLLLLAYLSCSLTHTPHTQILSFVQRLTLSILSPLYPQAQHKHH